MSQATTRILVTGGAGFLGSHLCQALLEKGHQVLCVDNFLTGRPENLSGVEVNPAFTFIEHDLTEPLYLEKHDQGPDQVDEIYHLASPASPPDYLSHPIHTMKVGALGTLHMLGLAKAHDARFLLASTSEVYGDPEVNPQPETYNGNVNPVGPRGVYDEAKRFGEALTMAYYRDHGLKTRIARIFNTYGPRMRVDDGRAIPNFITQALTGEPMTVYGDGSQTRSFCHVSDLIGGLVALMERGDEQPTNLGNPHEMTILELAEVIRQRVGATSEIVHEALPTDDPQVRRPDITRAKERLDWRPEVPFDTGIRATIAYFREHLDVQATVDPERPGSR